MRVGAHLDGRFRLEAKHGSGGMGTVFRARDEQRGCNVAVKVLRRSGVEDIARFEREVTALSRLSHPAIVGYVAHGQDGDDRYLVMDWADGRTLRAHLQQVGIDLTETVELGRRLASGLGVSHREGILHRDVKPDNVILVDGSLANATIVDFGIAKQANEQGALTRTGVMVGTPAFMSPEQARAEKSLDARSDVFGLGCLLYQCITGYAPFGGGYWVSVRLKVLLSEPPRVERLHPDAPPALGALVERMLAKDPATRPKDGNEVARELAALAPMPSSERRRADPNATISQCSLAKADASGSKYLVLALCDDDDDDDGAERTVEQAVWSRRVRSLETAVAPYGADLDVLSDGSALATLSGSHDQANSAAACALALRRRLPDFPIRVARIGAGDGDAAADVAGDIEKTVNQLVKGAVSAVFEGPGNESTIHVDPEVAARVDEKFAIVRKGADFVLLGPRAGSET